MEDNTNSPVLLQSEHIVPTLINVLQSPFYTDPNASPKMLQLSLQCLHTLIEPLPTALVLHMEIYLQILSSLSTHTSNAVQAQACKTISSLLVMRTEYLQPHIASITEFILKSMSNTDESVALEAAEFWLHYATLDEESLTPLMQSTLTEIYPRMVFSEEKIQDILIENEEVLQEQQMNHNIHLAKIKLQSFIDLRLHRNQEIQKNNPNMDDDDDDSTWTLRKCAAATLDSLSALLPASIILPPLLPLLQSGLSNTDNIWVREASILARGAIAYGCHTEMTQNYLPQLHPFLIQQIEVESIPQIRCIACWTLSRYADWTLAHEDRWLRKEGTDI